ncbi:DUF4197 domain-containing protein [Qipengyuania nanhaisediminis]|uniref:DUF4197 domain-containing protein n=1 Tax=Qipengyuania nanhaisediminis TaxID=604088 RepID=UPI0038B2386B
MTRASMTVGRRQFVTGALAGGIALAMPGMASAQGGLGLSSLLGRASDNALDKLAQPGAFYDDESIRIGLPIVGGLGGRSGGLLGSLMSAGNRLGVLGTITRDINDAAGVAAGEAKPIFRDAIDDLSFSDAPEIIRRKDGGTRYLRTSSNDRLHVALQPLVDGALERAGVYSTFERLAGEHAFIKQAGLDREQMNRSVTDQGLDGIFAYIGAEERGFRDNPLGGLGRLLGN